MIAVGAADKIKQIFILNAEFFFSKIGLSIGSPTI